MPDPDPPATAGDAPIPSQIRTRQLGRARPGTLAIHAAILAIKHSFIVDNRYWGAPLGALTVDGAIAQSLRGPVGTFSSGGLVTGYGKDYTYSDRLRFREQPYFID